MKECDLRIAQQKNVHRSRRNVVHACVGTEKSSAGTQAVHSALVFGESRIFKDRVRALQFLRFGEECLTRGSVRARIISVR